MLALALSANAEGGAGPVAAEGLLLPLIEALLVTTPL